MELRLQLTGIYEIFIKKESIFYELEKGDT